MTAQTSPLCLPCARLVLSGETKYPGCPKCERLKIKPLWARSKDSAEIMVLRDAAARPGVFEEPGEKPDMGAALAFNRPNNQPRRKRYMNRRTQ